MKHQRAGQAASVVRPPMQSLWRETPETVIRRMIAQDFKDAPELLEPAITPEEAEEIRRMDRERINGDQRIWEWIKSLPKAPPIEIDRMPTLGQVEAFYGADTTEVPSEPALR